LIDAYVAGVIELGELAERRRSLEERLAQLGEELAELKGQQREQIREEEVLRSLEAFQKAVGAGLEGLTFAERQELVRLLVEEVEVAGSEVRIKHIIPIGRVIDLPLRSRH
jgi:site-specific DNA recombinase